MQERGWMQGDCVCCFGQPFLSLRRLSLLLWPTLLKLYVTCKSYGGCICKKGAGCKETASAALADLS